MRILRELVLSEVTAVVRAIDARASAKFVAELRRAKRIYLAGVGRSGLMVKAFGQRLMHLGYGVHLADEITAPAIRRGDLLVACSGSGKTQLTLYMARKARRVGARVIALVSQRGVPLAREARSVVEIPAPPNGSSQPARTAFEQALMLYLDSVVLALMEDLRIPVGRIERRHANLE